MIVYVSRYYLVKRRLTECRSTQKRYKSFFL